MTSNRTHRRRTTRLLAAPAVAVVGLVALAGAATADEAAAKSGNGVTPTYTAGNPSCADITPDGATWTEAKLDFDPAPGDYTRGDLEITIAKSADGLEWTTDGDVAAVIMKGGPNAYVYAYPGTDDTHDTGLRPPPNPNSSKDYGISHVTFCIGAGTPMVTPSEPEQPAEPEVPVAPQAPVVPETPAPAAEVQAAAVEATDAQVLGVTLEAPAVAAAELPRTGVETGLLALIGVVLLAAGGVLVSLAGRPTGEAG